LRKAAERYGREPLKVSSEALAQMAAYRWPGNVRELQNAIQFAFVRCTGPVIRPYDLPLEIREFQSTALSRGPGRKLDTTAVAAMLKKTGGNKARAAKLLGVGRATLYRFLTAQPEAAAGEPGD
jgi:transcriptional regulator of acetoin/glycerol metabolism